MQRRDFFKQSAAALSGLALAPMASLRNPFAAEANFSLCIVTDQPERTIALISQCIGHAALPAHPVRFEEYHISGQHMGDIVCFRDRQLWDFRQARGDFSAGLRQVAHVLGFPRPLDHPLLLKFSTETTGQQATHANIFQGNVLIDQLRLDTNQSAYVVEGSRGSLALAVTDRKVQVVEASCKHKTCMQMGHIHRPGESLVCIPSHLSITLNGTLHRGIDSITH